MPNITEFNPPNLDLNPSERGVSAWDSTARRINAFYGDVAGYQRQQGALAAQAAKLKLWPFDILALYAANAKGATGVGVRVRGARATFGGPTENFAGFGESRNTGAPASFNDFSQISAGAAGLGRGLADGGYQAARMPRGGGGGGGVAEPSGPDYTLLHGEFVTLAQERKLAAEDAVAEYQRQNTWGDYVRKYYGREPNGIATGPGTTLPDEGRPEPNMYLPTPQNIPGYWNTPVRGTDWGEYIYNRTVGATEFPEAFSRAAPNDLPVPGF